jgi:hypothetical protein
VDALLDVVAIHTNGRRPEKATADRLSRRLHAYQPQLDLDLVPDRGLTHARNRKLHMRTTFAKENFDNRARLAHALHQSRSR